MKNIRLGLSLVPFLMAMMVFTGCEISSDEDEEVKDAVTEKLDNIVPFNAGADKIVAYGSGSFTQKATDGEGNGTVSYLSSNTTIANVDAITGEVTVFNAGWTIIEATKAKVVTPDGNISAQTDSYLLTVTRASQSIKFNIDSKDLIYAPATTYTESADLTGAIGTGAVEYNSTNTFVATVSGTGEVTVLKGGTATIIVTKKEDSKYAQASDSYTLTVGRAQQVIAFTSPTLNTATDVNFTDPNFQEQAALVGIGGSGAITYESSNPSVAATIGTDGWIDILTAGTTTITATKAADDSYYAASDTGTDFTTTYTVAPQNHSQPATGGQGTGNITWSSSNPTVASIADPTSNVVTILKAGKATITAIKAADINLYLSSDSYLLTVNEMNMPIEAGSAKAATLAQTGYDQPATPTGYTYQYESNDSNVATVDATGHVTINGAGTCEIKATLNQENYKKNTDTYILTVTKAVAVVEAGDSKTATMGDDVYSQPATPVGPVYAYESNDTNVATVDTAGDVTMVGTGSCTITAKINDPRYEDANDSYTLTVPKTFCLETSPIYDCGGQTCE